MARLLIVEDDSSLREGIAYALEAEGFEVACARDCAGAYALIPEGWDMLLLDIGLPDGSGLDICRKVREGGDVPIIFLTARDEETSVVMGLDTGGDDYITKPFRVRELVSRIRAVLRRREEKPADPVLRSEGLCLDLRLGRLLRQGEPVTLSKQEYKLLLLFMGNPGQVLTRDHLLMRIWDEEGAFVDDNTLTVAIRRLREKLETDPNSPQLIQTVRGSGYRWAAQVTRGQS